MLRNHFTMSKKLILTSAICCFYSDCFSQQIKDTLTVDDIVLTGQFNPQSIKKSLYKVDLVTADDIKRMGSNNVAEVLSQTLNILIIPEKNSGDSKANIMELNADYTKVLVDNIPIIGDTGLGSNIDLTKLSVDTIDRIEIVKGSMGVEFGNNAVAGVINIITKKSSTKKWNVRGFIQEETLGNEYNWVNVGKGRHVQSLAVSHNINDKWYANLQINRNDFQGFWGDLQGKNGIVSNERGYHWQPKEIINPSLLVRFKNKKMQLFYKADVLKEEINYYNPLVTPKYLGAGERTFLAADRDYFTTRTLQQFNIQSEVFKKSKLTLDLSYQQQKRQKQDYIFDVPQRSEMSRDAKETYYKADTWYGRATLNNFMPWQNIDLQVGVESDYTKGFAGWSTGSFSGNNIERNIFNAALFAASEINLSDKWFLRPGLRLNLSDSYETKPNFSLVLKHKIDDRSEFRAIVGSANRNPTFEELFTHMVDSNHDIRGNEHLKPENSYSGTLFYTLNQPSTSNFKWSLDVSSMYLQVQNRIELAVVNQSPVQYKYINVDTYESWLNSVNAKFSHANFGINAGFSVLGRSLGLEGLQEDNYRYSIEFNSALYYNLLKTGTTFSLFYKGIGKSYSITENNDLGITQYLVGKRRAFSLMDFSISQKINQDHFNIALGVRNLFNISTVNNEIISGGSHGMANGGERLFYGRSYYARINFNF